MGIRNPPMTCKCGETGKYDKEEDNDLKDTESVEKSDAPLRQGRVQDDAEGDTANTDTTSNPSVRLGLSSSEQDIISKC